jgi:hypothetical protein
MEDTFTVAQNLTFGEYFRFTLLQLLSTKIIKRLFMSVTVIGLLAGLSGLLTPGNNEAFSIVSLLKCLMPPVFLFLFFFIVLLLAGIFIVRFKPHIIRGITYLPIHTLGNGENCYADSYHCSMA